MKVLHVHTAYRERGGEDAVVETERAILADAGVDVVPFDARNPVGTAAAAAALASATWNDHAARRVVARADREGVEVVHLHNTWFALTASVPARLSAAGFPVVATLHNYRLLCANGLLFRDGHHCEDCLGGRTWPAIAHACYRGSRPQSVLAAAPIAVHRRLGTWERAVDRFLTLTPAAAQVFVRAGVPSSRLRLRPNVVRDPGPRPEPPSWSGTVLFVGRLSPEKGLATLLDAWRRARPPGLRLLVVGDGPERHLQAGAAEDVRFVGHQTPAEVRAHMLGARILVFPSGYAETFGLVPVEAMAAGLPLLISDVGDVPGLVGARGTPQVLPAGDVAAWADALAGLSAASWLDGQGERNRHRYQETFAPQGAAAALTEVYREVVAERSARGGAGPGQG